MPTFINDAQYSLLVVKLSYWLVAILSDLPVTFVLDKFTVFTVFCGMLVALVAICHLFEIRNIG